ncbi:MAG: hypothetical protein V4671_08185 [Armatimonadota bacterium]
MKIYSLDTPDVGDVGDVGDVRNGGNGGNVGTRKSASRKPPAFRFTFCVLTALIVSCLMISAESLVDVILYSRVDFPVRRALVQLSRAVGILPLYVFGVYYWPPIFIVSLWAGFTHYTKGLLYSCLGVAVFLILLHNFRCFGTHHNVFETAEAIRQSTKTHQPPSEFWDIAYLACAFIGGLMGMFLNVKFKNKDVKDSNDSGPGARANPQAVVKTALIFGTLCMIFGFVEFAIQLSLERNMLYSSLPAMTHCYAIVAMGLLTVGAALYKDHYQEAAVI